MGDSGGISVAITGASKGLGLELARLFAAAGHTVAGCSRGDSSFESPRYRHTQLDIGNEEEVRRWIRGIKKESGRLDLLVCNAGVMESVLPLTMTPDRVLDAYLRTNVAGTFHVCREAGKLMAVQRSGRIVAISSTMTKLHEPGTAAYSAAKSAVEEMMRVLARELAGAGVTCNIIAPGLIATEASAAFGDEWRERVLALQTIKRPVTAAEIFHAVSFFASPAAAMVTGQTLCMGLVN
jgi:3-oxoacyl-[acyl-carrier protein] reductase